MDHASMLQEQSGQESGNPVNPSEAKSDRGSGALGLFVDDNRTRFDPLVESLRAHGAGLASDLDALNQGLEQAPGNRAIVFFSNPAMKLGEQLLDGKRLPEALAEWREETECLLARFRRDRRRITLVDGHAALRAPDEFRRQLGTRLSLPFDTQIRETAEAREPAGLIHLAASQALRQEATTAALLDELEASSLALGPAYQVNVEAIIDERATQAPTPALEAIREENELLLIQLRQLQAVFETQMAEGNQADKLRAAAKRARQRKESVEIDFTEAREAWREERKTLTDKLKWTADDLAAVRRSLSWRITSPLRRLLGFFFGGSKL